MNVFDTQDVSFNRFKRQSSFPQRANLRLILIQKHWGGRDLVSKKITRY